MHSDLIYTAPIPLKSYTCTISGEQWLKWQSVEEAQGNERQDQDTADVESRGE